MFYNKIMKWMPLIVLLLITGCATQPIVAPVSSLTPAASITAVVTSTQSKLSSTLPSPSATAIPPLFFEKGPYLIFTGRPDAVRILWQPLEQEDLTLQWGLDERFSSGLIQPQADYETGLFSVILEGLVPATRYYYRISTSSAEISGSFDTAPESGSTDLVFWVYGDTRAGPEIHDQISAAILSQTTQEQDKKSFIINLGDLMNVATEESLQSNEFDPGMVHTRRVMSEFPMVNVMGNHDGTAIFKKYYPYPFSPANDWSFDYGPAHITILNQYLELVQGSARWEWLRNDLASSDRPWKFILLHEPGWSAGAHENNLTVQKIIHPLAVAYHVDMVMAGHNHYYSRAKVDGVTHLTSGGGGTPLYDPDPGWPRVEKALKAFHFVRIQIAGEELTAQVLSPDGQLLDEFSISHQEE